MNKLKTVWKENKKKVLLYGGISFITIILLIVIIVILVNVFKKYDYTSIEKIMVDASKSYLKDNRDMIPTETNPEITLDVESLVAGKHMKELSKLSKDSACTGKIKVTLNGEKLRYTPYLECSDYATTSLAKTILNRETIVSSNAGLYLMNDFYTYRGEYVNNYVNFLDYTWRILKFDDDMMYLVSADTLNNKTLYVYDDRFNESVNSYRGKNDFENSRMKTTLMDFYNGYFSKKHATLLYMNACVHRRSETDTDKAGNIECHTTSSTPISLMSVYDYMNASVDELCINSTSRNCSNYNYLAKTKNRYWLLNGTNENSYGVYFASTNGTLEIDAASSKKDLRIVIAIPSDILYKNGNGTSASPFTFYEY